MVKKRSAAGKGWLRPRVRVMLGSEIALGPGRVDLLERIQQTGSLRAAAELMGISYMRAWQLVKHSNCCFKEPLVEVVRGGKTGGGAKMTDTGLKIIALYRQMEQEFHAAVRTPWSDLRRRLAK